MGSFGRDIFGMVPFDFPFSLLSRDLSDEFFEEEKWLKKKFQQRVEILS